MIGLAAAVAALCLFLPLLLGVLGPARTRVADVPGWIGAVLDAVLGLLLAHLLVPWDATTSWAWVVALVGLALLAAVPWTRPDGLRRSARHPRRAAAGLVTRVVLLGGAVWLLA